jgi:hypothetical protein
MEWEYKVIKTEDISKSTEPRKLQDELNDYGKEGWELICFASPPPIGEGWMSKLDEDSAIFKRQVSIV